MTEAKEYLIKKGSYFYRPNSQGYTSFKFDAGRYTKADAEKEAAIEPWHMQAIHQDDVPEETAPDKEFAKMKQALANWRDEVGKLHSQIARKDAHIVVLTERLQAIIDWCDIAMKNADEFDSHGVRNLDGPIFDEARAVLASAE